MFVALCIKIEYEGILLTEKTFAAKDINLNYAEGPSSGQPLVLLHGVTNRWQNWLSVLPILGWNYHCFALDQRGHGHSEHAKDGYQSDRFAQDVIHFLSDIVKQPVILIGHSLGSMITIKVASQAPELLRAIVLSDPPLSGAADGGGDPPLWFQQYLDLVSSSNSRTEMLAILENLTPGADPTVIQMHLKSLEMLDPEVLISGATDRLFKDFFLTDLVPKITCPVLLIQGNPSLGGVIEDQDLKQVLALKPDITHIYLSDMGHNLHIPQPNTFATIVTNFIEAID